MRTATDSARFYILGNKPKSAEQVGACDTANCAFFAQISGRIRDKLRRNFGSKSRSTSSRLRPAGGEPMPGLAAIPGRMYCVATALGLPAPAG
jgi:hypothetical protein